MFTALPQPKLALSRGPAQRPSFAVAAFKPVTPTGQGKTRMADDGRERRTQLVKERIQQLCSQVWPRTVSGKEACLNQVLENNSLFSYREKQFHLCLHQMHFESRILHRKPTGRLLLIVQLRSFLSIFSKEHLYCLNK